MRSDVRNALLPGRTPGVMSTDAARRGAPQSIGANFLNWTVIRVEKAGCYQTR
jgi:hypothetical protein